ncbi:hypothetical protein [Actinomadura rugatobispora]|uniref:Uncharacterized protein n=1 Tax=Actinomadura rugatobispora TaxID=1994 RepID=A0ABW0ZT39_9ACTN|nr:hypothetical protein GCM10010200_024360 [Actinomadura rugatobispora]
MDERGPDADVVARWRWVYDYPDDPPGGFVFGEMVLYADGTLLRRYGDGGLPWAPVLWWPGERDPGRAAALLASRGYGLHPA